MAGVPELSDYYVSPVYGFFVKDPLTSLPEYFKPWEEIGKNLSSLLESKNLREAVQQLPLLDHTKLKGYREVVLAYSYLSFMANGYVWQDGDKGVSATLPRQVAIPLCALAGYIGTKPAAGYTSITLTNWKKIDPAGPLDSSNIDCFIELLSNPDYKVFQRATFQMELSGIPGVKACIDALKAVMEHDKVTIINSLGILREAIITMQSCFKLYEKPDPDFFFFTFAPLTTGWGGETSALPEGLIYEGVSPDPIKVLTANVGHSSMIYTFDTTLGIQHNKEAQAHKDDVLYYMPYYHREFILALRRAPSLKDFVMNAHDSELSEAYNLTVNALVEFRSAHIRLVTRQLVIPSKKEAKVQLASKKAAEPEDIRGAMGYLKSIRDVTASQALS